jgi:hypothetical protein
MSTDQTKSCYEASTLNYNSSLTDISSNTAFSFSTTEFYFSASTLTITNALSSLPPPSFSQLVVTDLTNIDTLCSNSVFEDIVTQTTTINYRPGTFETTSIKPYFTTTSLCGYAEAVFTFSSSGTNTADQFASVDSSTGNITILTSAPAGEYFLIVSGAT